MSDTTTEPRPAVGEGDLVVAGLGLQYGTVTALRGVDLVVPRGSVVALLGANGAGKTSLLRAVSGNTRHHRARVSGGIHWRGRSIVGSTPEQTVRAGIAQVPEGRRVFASMSVHDNLLTGSTGRGGKAVLDEVYERFPVLAERRTQHAGLLSGGEQQQLVIGRALMTRPDLLLLDEPSLGLAPLMVGRIMSVIREINARGTSVLLVEQNASMALELADHVTVLELGRVARSGPTDDLDLLSDIRALYLSDAAAPDPVDAVGAVSRPPLAPWNPRTEENR